MPSQVLHNQVHKQRETNGGGVNSLTHHPLLPQLPQQQPHQSMMKTAVMMTWT